MAKVIISQVPFLLLLLLLLISILYMLGSVNSAPIAYSRPSGRPTAYLKASCGATQYPALCVQSLSVYSSGVQRNPQQLAHAALSVSLSRARTTAVYVSRMSRVKGMKKREFYAVKDCVDNMGDSVDRLSKSIKELGNMGKGGAREFMWHMGNVQTWVSAALTDETTCVDGFSGNDMNGHVKASIRTRVLNVAQVTSNALALVNRFAAKHRA